MSSKRQRLLVLTWMIRHNERVAECEAYLKEIGYDNRGRMLPR